MRSVVTGHRIWSDEDDAKVRECYAAGSSVNDLARELGTSGGAVIGRASRLGLQHASWHGEGNRNAWATRRARYGAGGRKPQEFADG